MNTRPLRLLAAALAVTTLAGCAASSARRDGGVAPLAVPATYRSYFSVAASRCPGVLTPASLAGQAYVESHFRADAVSTRGAQGLMQVIPAVWNRYGTDANGDGRADPFTPADSVATSAKFSCALARGVREVPGDRLALRLAAYNAGLDAVRRYGGVPPYPETRRYVEQVQVWTARLASQGEAQPAA